MPNVKSDVPTHGRVADPGPPPKDVKNNDPVYLAWMQQRRRFLAQEDPSVLGGRPKRGSAKALAIAARGEKEKIKTLEPRAVDLLEAQLNGEDTCEHCGRSSDEKLRQSAAIKILEYSRGKPAQTIKGDKDAPLAIIYESAAWRAPVMN